MTKNYERATVDDLYRFYYMVESKHSEGHFTQTFKIPTINKTLKISANGLSFLYGRSMLKIYLEGVVDQLLIDKKEVPKELGESCFIEKYNSPALEIVIKKKERSCNP